jgi:hypothetical protein
MVNTTEIRVSNQQFSVVPEGHVSIPEGYSTALVEVTDTFMTVRTGTDWGPITLSISTDEEDLAAVNDDEWDAIEEGYFYKIAPLRVETNDGTVWGDFTDLGKLPRKGKIEFRVLAKGRTQGWGRDSETAEEQYYLIFWSAAAGAPQRPKHWLVKSDGKNSITPRPSNTPYTPDDHDASDARVRTIGPYTFGSE